MDISELRRTPIADLRVMAEGLNIQNLQGLRKQDLIYRIEHSLLASDVALRAEGTLELLPEGFGFLRSADWNYLAGPDASA
jgi:transcription termination factor Rho